MHEALLPSFHNCFQPQYRTIKRSSSLTENSWSTDRQVEFLRSVHTSKHETTWHFEVQDTASKKSGNNDCNNYVDNCSLNTALVALCKASAVNVCRKSQSQRRWQCRMLTHLYLFHYSIARQKSVLFVENWSWLHRTHHHYRIYDTFCC